MHDKAKKSYIKIKNLYNKMQLKNKKTKRKIRKKIWRNKNYEKHGKTN